MRGGRWALLFACAIASASQLLAAAGDTTIVADGKSDHRIVLSASAIPSEKRAAAELQSHLKQMSGALLPVVTDDEPLPARSILLGRSKHTDALGVDLDPGALGLDRPFSKAEGFVLRTAGPHVVVAGPGPRGTMYGVSALLERLGVRWFTPKVTRVPRRTTVTLPQIDETHSPAFEYREPYFAEALDKDWAARLRLNGNFPALDASTGGKFSYHTWCHTFDELVPRSHFAAHPEYFPLIKGKRTDGYVQRCLSNPDVLKISVEKVREWIKRAPDAQLFSVSQNDTHHPCECDACRAIEKKYGGVHSGLYLWFVNAVAEAVEKDHPDKLIDTLAYQFTEAPPSGIAPRKNVRVRLCPIACCQAHPYERCAARPNKDFLKHLKGWGALTDTLYVWHYNTNFGHYLMPFPDFDEFPAEARLYKRHGVKGVFFQGAYSSPGGSDAELRSYVMAKLLWDVNADADALVTEWVQGVYGNASRPMRAWFDLLHEKVRRPDKHFYIGSDPTVYYLSSEVLQAGDKLFDEAQRLAQGDAVATEYVDKARLGLRYVKLVRERDAGPAFDAFLADLRRFGITQVNEAQGLAQWEKRHRDAARK